MARKLSKQPVVQKTSSGSRPKRAQSNRGRQSKPRSSGGNAPINPDDAANHIQERIRNAYHPGITAFVHALHRSDINSLAGLAEARTPEAFERAAGEGRRAKQYTSWLYFASKIADHHRITDPGHHELAKKLAVIRDSFVSAQALRPETKSWSVPHGLPPWKESQRKLDTLLRRIIAVENAVGAVSKDPVAMGAIVHRDAWQGFPNMFSSVHSMRELVQSAAGLEARAGNRALPNWTVEAAEACRNYWPRVGRGEPTPLFDRAKVTGTAPDNDFSKWFCDLMFVLARLRPSQCETILKKKKPPRPPRIPYAARGKPAE